MKSFNLIFWDKFLTGLITVVATTVGRAGGEVLYDLVRVAVFNSRIYKRLDKQYKKIVDEMLRKKCGEVSLLEKK